MQARRDPGVAFGQPIIISVLIGLLFSALFSAVDQIEGFPVPTYDDWVLPGTLFLSAVVGAGFSPAELLRDLQTGFLDRMRLSTADPVALVVGRAGFEAVRGAIAAAVVLGVGLARGLQNEGGLVGAIFLVLLTAGFAFAWNGVFFYFAIKTQNPAAVLGLQPLFFPVLLFSTWFGPRLLMPDWYETVARFNPVTAYLDSMRSSLVGDLDGGLVAISVLFIIGLSVLSYGGAVRQYRMLGRSNP